MLAGALLGGRSDSKASASYSLQVIGSETLRPLVAACAESFMAAHPNADVIVRGGGSGDGIASLLHGMADIGMASRSLTTKEQAFAASKGVESTLAEWALDGIAVIVHPSNALRELDIDQVRRVFSGAIVNWRDLGAAEGAGVSGPGDLPGLRVAAVAGSPGEHWLAVQGQAARSCPFVIQASKALKRGEVDALVFERAILGHMIKEYGWKDLKLLPHTVAIRDYALALPAGSPLTEDVNRALLGTVQHPDWRGMTQRYLGDVER